MALAHPPPSGDLPCSTRPFEINDDASNVIQTSKFNAWNFLPFLIWTVIKEPLNVFVIVLFVFEMLPSDVPRVDEKVVSNSRLPTNLIPFAFILFVTIYRLLSEDNKRREMDKRANGKDALILESEAVVSGAEEVEELENDAGLEPQDRENYNFSWSSYHTRIIPWGDIKIGHVIEIPPGSAIPADCIILDTSVKYGIGYVESSQLDGESHLKLKNMPTNLLTEARAGGEFKTMFNAYDVTLQCEEANGDVEDYRGQLVLTPKNSGCDPTTPIQIKLDIDNILLRGLTAQGDVGMVGLVFRVGKECKLFKHLSQKETDAKSGLKESKERITLTVMFGVFTRIIIYTLCLNVIFAICMAARGGSIYNDMVYTWAGKKVPLYVNIVRQILDFCYTLMGTASAVPLNLIALTETLQWVKVWLLGKDESFDQDLEDARIEKERIEAEKARRKEERLKRQDSQKTRSFGPNSSGAINTTIGPHQMEVNSATGAQMITRSNVASLSFQAQTSPQDLAVQKSQSVGGIMQKSLSTGSNRRTGQLERSPSKSSVRSSHRPAAHADRCPPNDFIADVGSAEKRCCCRRRRKNVDIGVGHDHDSSYEPRGNRSVHVNALNCLEDFCVAHIVSDKTGTLTKNEMVFRGLGIGNGLSIYGVPKDCDLYGDGGKAKSKAKRFQPDVTTVEYAVDYVHETRDSERGQNFENHVVAQVQSASHHHHVHLGDKDDGIVGLASGAAHSSINRRNHALERTSTNSVLADPNARTSDLYMPHVDVALQRSYSRAKRSSKRFTKRVELEGKLEEQDTARRIMSANPRKQLQAGATVMTELWNSDTRENSVEDRLQYMNFDETDFLRDLMYGYGDSVVGDDALHTTLKDMLSEGAGHQKITDEGRAYIEQTIRESLGPRPGTNVDRAMADTSTGMTIIGRTTSPDNPKPNMSVFNPAKSSEMDDVESAWFPYYARNVYFMENIKVERIFDQIHHNRSQKSWLKESIYRSALDMRHEMISVGRDNELFNLDQWETAQHDSPNQEGDKSSHHRSSHQRSCSVVTALFSSAQKDGGGLPADTTNPAIQAKTRHVLFQSTNNGKLRGPSPSDMKRLYQQKAKDLLVNMTVNHTVHSCRFLPKGDNTSLIKIKEDLYYFATSPDELAFVAFGSELGVTFTGRDGNIVDYTSSNEKLFDNLFYPSRAGIYAQRKARANAAMAENSGGGAGNEPTGGDIPAAAEKQVTGEPRKPDQNSDRNDGDNPPRSSIGNDKGSPPPRNSSTKHGIDISIQAVARGTFIEIKRIFEFDSTRKRMTVVCRLPGQDPPGMLRMLSKGADTGILPWCHPDPTYNIYRQHLEGNGYLKPTPQYESPVEKGLTDSHGFREAINMLDAFSHQGWRTLCFSQRLIREDEFERWCFNYDALDEELEESKKKSEKMDGGKAEARRSGLHGTETADRKFASGDGMPKTPSYRDEIERMKEIKKIVQKKKTALLQKLEEVQSGFEYLGCTAIEDILQDDLCETLTSFRKAGITTWVLTGDKVETGIAIGLSCGLIHNTMTQVLVLQERVEELLELGPEAFEYFMSETAVLVESVGGINCVLVIDGISVRMIWERPQLLPAFQALLVKFNTVLACRVTPQQKADMTVLAQLQGFSTKELREIDNLGEPSIARRAQKHGKRVLGIGDGANDVPMLEQANMGVGIRGKEGGLASQVADISVARFKDLGRLIFIYGHETRRNFGTIVKLAIQRIMIHVGAAPFFIFFESAFEYLNLMPELIQTFMLNFLSTTNQLALSSAFSYEKTCQNPDDLLRNGKFYNAHCIRHIAPLDESTGPESEMKSVVEGNNLVEQQYQVTGTVSKDNAEENDDGFYDYEKAIRARSVRIIATPADAERARNARVRKYNPWLFTVFDFHNKQPYESYWIFVAIAIFQFYQGALSYICFWKLVDDIELEGTGLYMRMRLLAWGNCILQPFVIWFGFADIRAITPQFIGFTVLALAFCPGMMLVNDWNPGKLFSWTDAGPFNFLGDFFGLILGNTWQSQDTGFWRQNPEYLGRTTTGSRATAGEVERDQDLKYRLASTNYYMQYFLGILIFEVLCFIPYWLYACTYIILVDLRKGALVHFPPDEVERGDDVVRQEPDLSRIEDGDEEDHSTDHDHDFHGGGSQGQVSVREGPTLGAAPFGSSQHDDSQYGNAAPSGSPPGGVFGSPQYGGPFGSPSQIQSGQYSALGGAKFTDSGAAPDAASSGAGIELVTTSHGVAPVNTASTDNSAFKSAAVNKDTSQVNSEDGLVFENSYDGPSKVPLLANQDQEIPE